MRGERTAVRGRVGDAYARSAFSNYARRNWGGTALAGAVIASAFLSLSNCPGERAPDFKTVVCKR